MSCCAVKLCMYFGKWAAKILGELMSLENTAKGDENNLKEVPAINKGDNIVQPQKWLAEVDVFPHLSIDGRFRNMKALTVLDLSKSELRVLPTEISELVSLQYLDISNTEIETLPQEIMKLEKLQSFNLEFTRKLKEIPRRMIGSLKLLQVFRIVGSNFILCTFSVEELERLESLKALSITIRDASIYNHVLNSHKLSRCIQSLLVEDLEPPFGELSGTKTQTTYGISKTRCFYSLCEVNINCCHYLQDLTWVMRAPNLTKLIVRHCENLQVISHGDVDEVLNLFARLQLLELIGLPQLKRICSKPMLFPFLLEIRVCGCPMLKKLPLNTNNAKGNQLVIEGTAEWWIKLQWEDHATRNAFKSCFQTIMWFHRRDGTSTSADRDRRLQHRLHCLHDKLDRLSENWRKIVELGSKKHFSEEANYKLNALVEELPRESQLQEASLDRNAEQLKGARGVAKNETF